MFCPACKKSFPDATEICPECQGELTRVIQIALNDSPDTDTDTENAGATAPDPSPEKREELPHQVLVMDSAVRPSTPNLWMASTILCTVLLFVVLFVDRADPPENQPAPTPTTAGTQIQANQDSSPEKVDEATPASEFAPPTETPQDIRSRASELLASARTYREQSAWSEAEKDAEEAYRLYRKVGGSNPELAACLEELAQIHIGMDRLLKAETELKQAQRLIFSKDRETLLASLLPEPVVQKATPVQSKKPSLGTPSVVPQAKPRVPQAKPRTEAYQTRPRMKEIEAYQKPQEEKADSTLPLGQQDVVEGYRSNKRTGRTRVPGY